MLMFCKLFIMKAALISVKILMFCRLFVNIKVYLISGVERLRAVATRLSSQAKLAGSAKPSSTPLPALATPSLDGSTWKEAWIGDTFVSTDL